MLKPFQIRDLHGSSPSNPEEPSSSQGVVQISSSDYDDLASTHPRARLTYIDDDDGDQITVGSSLELSERLDDPVDIAPQLTSIRISDDTPVPMHIFDIRRSNSVTELWRRFETQTSNATQVSVSGNDTPAVLEPSANTVDHLRYEEPISARTSASAIPGTDSQPLLAAFEAELASLLGSTEEPPQRAPQPEPQHAAEGVNLEELPTIVANLASQILRHMSSGANMMQSELRTRLPELQRQVNDAQRHLPENMGAWLQSLITSLETQMKTVLNNLPENRRQWADNGRQWAEEAIHAGRPVAENAAESLRTMATELNEVGRTLFAAFEHEFGRSTSQQTTPEGTTSDEPSSSHTAVPPVVNNENSAPVNPETDFRQSVAPEVHQEIMPRCDQPPAPGLGGSNYAPIPIPGNVNRGPEMPYALPALPSAMPYMPRINPHLPGHYRPSYPQVPPPPRLMRPPNMNNWYPPLRAPPPTELNHGHPTSSTFSRLSHWNLYPRMPYLAPNAGSNNVDVPSRTPSSRSMTTHKDAQVELSENKTLFIGNVGFNVTEQTVKDVFASKGFIVDVNLPLDAVSGKHAGFGYLHFPSIHPALAAMNALQGAHIDGHAINLELSDTAPIEDINSQGTTLNTSQPSVQSNIPKEATHFSEWKHKQNASNKRRKSVSFKEPLQAHPQPVTAESQDAEPAAVQATDVAQSSPLIDLSVDETIATPQPLLQSGSESYRRTPVSSANPESSVNLNPELEMSRFPPVSQLEAQLLAKQRKHDPESTADGAATNSVNHSGDLASPFHAQTQPLLPTQVPYVPYRSGPEVALQRSRTISHPDSRGNYVDSGTSLRRAKNFTSDPSWSELPSHSRQLAEAPRVSRLRRRASERQSMRPARELDTWARLDRRERERSRPASRHSIPGSFPVEDSPSPPLSTSVSNAEASEIERCVSSLIDMGYGTTENGGQARMAIYAAASNGSLLDAIEMIEEERKVYASHGQE
ncbi:hypothetical protein N7488_001203 [Penicillium malachiteum]|nr:hypothetical protein N7488_001203 [Penicillium malachiteum]